MKCIAPDENAVAPYLPELVQQAMGQALAAGAAAENQDAAAEKPTARPQLDNGLAAQLGAVEQNRLGRQVFEPGALAHRQMLRDFGGGAGRTVDLFRRRGGDLRRCVFLGLYGYREPVAGDEAAGSGEQYRERDVARLGCREQHAQRVALVKMREPGRAVAMDEPDLSDARYP